MTLTPSSSTPHFDRVSADERGALLSEVVRTAEIGWYIWDISDPVPTVYWSPSLFRIFGIDPATTAASTGLFLDLVHPDDLEDVKVAWDHAVNAAEDRPSAYRIIRHDGTVRHLRVRGSVILDLHPPRKRLVGTVLDVTESIEASARLAGALTLLEDTQQAAGVGTYVFYLEDGRMEWSDELRRIVGVSPTEVVTGELAMTRVHPDDRARQEAWFAQILAGGGGAAPSLARVLRGDGTTRFVETRARLIVPEPSPEPPVVGDGRGSRVVGVCIDVTSRIELEEKLRHAAKMEAIGTLASGVAHNFNNHLALLVLHLETLRRLAGPPDPALVAEMAHAAAQCAALTRELLTFARKQPSAVSSVDLTALVRNVASLFGRLVDSGIEIVVDVPEEPLVLDVDAAQIESTLMNIAVNARDAMPDGGTLHIAVDVRSIGPASPELDVALAPGRYACIRFTDTGTGIAEADLPRVFEPYFSTKDEGKGTGLGLASAYGVVRQHGGFLRLESVPGVGTTFFVYLPARDGATVPAPSIEAPKVSPSTAPVAPLREVVPSLRGLRALVAEDMEPLRRLVVRVLTLAGLAVTSACDGVEALAAFRQAPVSIVVTDLRMPRMGGLELARNIRETTKETLLVFITGYADDAVAKTIEAEFPGSIVLRKPFAAADLRTAVEAVVGAALPKGV